MLALLLLPTTILDLRFQAWSITVAKTSLHIYNLGMYPYAIWMSRLRCIT